MSAVSHKILVQLTGRLESIEIGIRQIQKQDQAHRRDAFLESTRPQAGLWAFVDSICRTQGRGKADKEEGPVTP